MHFCCFIELFNEDYVSTLSIFSSRKTTDASGSADSGQTNSAALNELKSALESLAPRLIYAVRKTESTIGEDLRTKVEKVAQISILSLLKPIHTIFNLPSVAPLHLGDAKVSIRSVNCGVTTSD